VIETYTGPLREEPLAIELHNTIYASGGKAIDAFDDPAQAAAWLAEIVARLPLRDYPPGAGPSIDELVELRSAVRTALGAAATGVPVDAEALAAINRASAGAPWSPAVAADGPGAFAQRSDHHGATFAEVVLAAFARDAIELLTGGKRSELRVCGAPGCVLMFLRDHPRREWCANACGNRARQARHYQRTRGG
jgi:predicted RNA-binding Zn ribbon-like protein